MFSHKNKLFGVLESSFFHVHRFFLNGSPCVTKWQFKQGMEVRISGK